MNNSVPTPSAPGVSAPPRTIDPFEFFASWYEDAHACAHLVDASAMSLATSSPGGRPSVRIVLLKEHGLRGFVFYTNVQSRKGHDLADNPLASLCFHWAPLKRQVRIDGRVEQVAHEEADEYFAKRPRLSQIGAWASKQSSAMRGRFALEPEVACAAMRFGAQQIPRPPYWTGFRVIPTEFEFWSEGAFRRHVRLHFKQREDGWETSWLYP